jgi:signal peptidase I
MWTLLAVVLILGVARAVAIRWVRLPVNDPTFEASVLPTLAGGDLILTSRIGQPTFGDLVLCPEPDYPDRFIIGRIIGEGGDKVRVVHSTPFVNGKRFQTERRCDPGQFTYFEPINDEEITQDCSWEALANHLHMMGTVGGFKVRPEELEFDVEEGTYFLISDNRLHPYDSRDYGLVDTSTCKETVVARLVSKDGWMDSENRLDYIQ